MQGDHDVGIGQLLEESEDGGKVLGLLRIKLCIIH